jgi:hypothetical protein
VAGLFWTEDGWPVAIQGLVPVSKLLVIPLLLYHYERSQRGHWVLFAFVASCALLMGLSWVTYFAGWNPSPGGIAGVPVRNYIDQSHEFALCLFVMAPLLCHSHQRSSRVDLRPRGHHVGLLPRHAVCCDLAHGNRVLPDLVDPLCRQISEPTACDLFLLFAAVVESGVLLSSPYLRDRVGRTVEDYKVDRDTSAARRSDPTQHRDIEWPAAGVLARFNPVDFRGAVFGHGTGSTLQLFSREAEGKSGEWANIIRNPHNQTLYVAIQWGLLGCLVLYAMWYFHLQLFRGSCFASWIGLVIVVQNFISLAAQSPTCFDFHEGWIYVLGVGVAGGMVARAQSLSALC